MESIYWISTLLTATYLIWSAWSYLFSPSVIKGVQALGFPSFFRIQLALLKPLAVIVILLPQIPMMYKEWAYAGVALFYLTAMVAHFAHRDPLLLNLINLVLLLVLLLSNYCLKNLEGIL